MNVTKVTVGGTVEILASKDFQAIPVKVATPGSGTEADDQTAVRPD